MGLFDMFKMPDLARGVEEWRKTEGALLLDVRGADEYAEGHLPGSVNVAIQRFGTLTAAKDTPIFVYCLSGARSRRAAALLTKLGYTDVHDIGGLMGYKGKLEK
ncbi:MAG: rhodanese-like domain-containing protein [Oscillospiraceae bacterium]|nr:rhodanese-like domain-containing protein [Oscillospiraceae bacterium]